MSSVEYYDHNAERYFSRSFRYLDRAALREFVVRLPHGGRVLDAGCGSGRDLAYFCSIGLEAEGVDACASLIELASRVPGIEKKLKRADLLLTSLAKESYDGIWANRLLVHLQPTACQRALALFFTGLKSGGILFVSIEEGEGSFEDRTDDPEGPARTIYRYLSDDFASLLRQSGFHILSVGRNLDFPGRLGFIARRI